MKKIFCVAFVLTCIAVSAPLKAQPGPASGPCNETNQKKKIECLNVWVGKLQAAIDTIKNKPVSGKFTVKQDRSGYCLTFLENDQNKAPILLTCDHPPNQTWTLSPQ